MRNIIVLDPSPPPWSWDEKMIMFRPAEILSAGQFNLGGKNHG